MDINETKKILSILYPLWPKGEIPGSAPVAYNMAFQGQDSGLLQAAAAEWVKTEKWMPKPVELIELAEEIARPKGFIRGATGFPPALPEPERKYTSLSKLLELRQTMVSMDIGTDLIDEKIQEARIREGQAA